MNKGFTLVELIVAIAIFSVVAGIAFGAVTSLIKHQSEVIATQNMMSNSSYALEYMERALRMARRDDSGTCLDQSGVNYRLVNIGSHIRFLDYENKCHEFLLGSQQIKEAVSSDNMDTNLGAARTLTSGNLVVTSLDFHITGDTGGQQPRVTTSLQIRSTEPEIKLNLQSTVSQRNLNL